MNIIYYLYHEYERNDNSKSHKGIGFFVSKIEAEEKIREYQLLPGFKKYKNKFYIKDFLIDNSLDFVCYPVNKSDTNYIYTVYMTKENVEPCYEYSILMGCFSTQDNANSFVDILKNQSIDNQTRVTIETYKEKIGVTGWKEGFKTVR